MIWRKETPKETVEEKQRGFDDFELRLGDILRGERATLGKSLLDVQRELHIRATYIAAIENGDLAAFEAPSFVAGFVRSYARYLGMDPEWVYERFCTEHDFQVAHGMSGKGTQARSTSTAPIAEPRSGALRGVGILPDPDPFWRRIEPGALGSITVLLALILGLGYAGWTVLKEVQRVQVAPADMVPNVVSDFNPLTQGGDSTLSAVDTDPLNGAGTLTSPISGEGVHVAGGHVAGGRVRMARAPALDVPVVTPRDGPIAAIVPQSQTPPQAGSTATDAAVAQALAPQALASNDAATPTDPSAPQVLGAAPDTVQLLAVRPAWLRVRAADGTVIFERILDAGERYTIPQTDQPPTLHAGNSGSVYFLIDGQAYGPAAPGAQVVRNVALSVDSLRHNYQLADLGRDQDLAVQVARLNQP